MADSSRAQVYYLEESSWGVTPASALNEFRFTSESLSYAIQNTTSNEVRDDRQVTDLIQTGASTSGSVSAEWSYGAYDDLIKGAMFSDWSTACAVSVNGDIAASNTNGNFSSTATDFTAQNLSVGQWVKVGGFTANSGENNGFYKVTSIAANALGVSPAPQSDEAAGGLDITIGGSMIRNGITERSYTLEKVFSDITQFISFTGMVVGGMNLNISSGAVLSGDFSFTGKQAAIAQATVGTGGAVAAPTGKVMNAVNNIGSIMEGGSEMAGVFVKSMSISLANNLRGQQAVGSLGNVGVGAGICAVTGKVEIYFENETLYEKYLNGSETSLSFRVTGDDGNSYVFTLPRISFTSGGVVAGGANQDVMASFDYQAVRDTSLGFTFQIDRIAA